MVESLQHLLQLDDATFRFFGIYIVVVTVLAASSLAYAKFRGAPSAVDTRAPRRERPPIVEASIAFGNRFVTFVAHLPITPNQITVIGLLLVWLNCALFFLSGNTLWFGSSLIAALLLDTLDGLVARAQGTSSKFGGYLDAVIDRYQEVSIYLTIGIVLDQWAAAFCIITGSMLTSYNKARVALEMPSSNKGWPDLLEKPLRLFILCVGLIGAPFIPWLLTFALWMLAAMTHFTALQRFTRAYFMFTDSAHNDSPSQR
jgi:phosphatidylglycerophosphate synthase